MTQIALVLPQGLDKTLCTNTQKALQQELDWLNSIRPTNCSARQIYLPSDHASGQEHQLAWRLELIHQPSAEERATPLVRLGVLCLNLATCYAIARAVYHAEPLTRRMITVNGSAQWVSFGTPVAKLVSPAWINGRHGGTPANPERAKIDASIFCVNDPPQVAIAPCINCSACRPACPVNLAPDLLFRFMQSEATPNAEVEAEAEAETDLNRCIECGACNAACPSGLWLTQSFRAAKQQKREALIRQQAAAKAKARVDARTSRLQAQKLEREERLQARAGQSERNKRAW